MTRTTAAWLMVWALTSLALLSWGMHQYRLRVKAERWAAAEEAALIVRARSVIADSSFSPDTLTLPTDSLIHRRLEP